MTFVPGHRLSAHLLGVIEPALAQQLPHLRFAAGLIGRGSDVLGYDTVRSTDHDWGPRLVLVLDQDEHLRCAEQVLDVVESVLPQEIHGVPVDHLPAQHDPHGPAVHHTTAGRRRPHGVTVRTLPDLLRDLLGITSPAELDGPTWLSIPAQSLLEFTAGPLLRDDEGHVHAARRALEFYPDQVWWTVMAGWWQRIAQLEPFVGRAREAGDDVGATVIAAGIVRAGMNLALLQQRRYPPYAKWLGTALARAPGGPELLALMRTALRAEGDEQLDALAHVLLALGKAHDHLDTTAPLQASSSAFFDRPYPVIWAGRFAEALRARVTDPVLRGVPGDYGSIDTITDHTPVLADRALRHHLRTWWRAG